MFYISMIVEVKLLMPVAVRGELEGYIGLGVVPVVGGSAFGMYVNDAGSGLPPGDEGAPDVLFLSRECREVTSQKNL